MNTFTVLSNKGHCSVQDLGRFQSQHLGFSASGAADEYAYRYGNALLGNTADDAALEIIFGQISLQANSPCTLVLTGSECHAQVNETSVNNWQCFTLQAGDILTLQQVTNGNYTYLCVMGGIQTPVFVGSRCQFPLTEQSPIQKGNVIPLATHCYRAVNNEKTTLNSRPTYFYAKNHLTLRFIPHQLWQTLTTSQQARFIKQLYKTSPHSNKMGIRLLGEAITIKPVQPMLSAPVAFGAIQLPPNGLPIILMKDRQTIGGYPTLGCVLQTDLFRLAQLPAMKTISFTPTTIEHAQMQLQSFYQKFNAE